MIWKTRLRAEVTTEGLILLCLFSDFFANSIFTVVLLSVGIDNPITMLKLESKRKMTTYKSELASQKQEDHQNWPGLFQVLALFRGGGLYNMFMAENKEASSNRTKSHGQNKYYTSQCSGEDTEFLLFT